MALSRGSGTAVYLRQLVLANEQAADDATAMGDVGLADLVEGWQLEGDEEISRHVCELLQAFLNVAVVAQ